MALAEGRPNLALGLGVRLDRFGERASGEAHPAEVVECRRQLGVRVTEGAADQRDRFEVGLLGRLVGPLLAQHEGEIVQRRLLERVILAIERPPLGQRMAVERRGLDPLVSGGDDLGQQLGGDDSVRWIDGGRSTRQGERFPRRSLGLGQVVLGAEGFDQLGQRRHERRLLVAAEVGAQGLDGPPSQGLRGGQITLFS